MRFNRRSFIKTAGSVTALSGSTYFLPFSLVSAQETKTPPSEKIRLGFIGMGGQGNSNLNPLMKDCVAVCDVDSDRLTAAVAKVEKANGKAPLAFADYRKLLESKEVDAVVVSTPDHWHALITVDACHAGKDVYCEKPLTLTIAEGRAIVNAARKNKRIVQTGSQQRSDEKFRRACEYVRSGRLGKIKEVKVGIPGPNFKGPPVEDGTPPKNLDYDFWLGPAPKRPYNEKRVHYLFRFFWDYSGGQLTNFGAHHLDIAQWGLGMDDSGPVSIEGTAQYHKEKWYETPETCQIIYTYANGVKVTCSMKEKGGATFIGEKGSIYVTRGTISSDPPEILKEMLGEMDTRLYVSTNHHKNWLDCIRTRKAPICEAEIGHRSATVCHLGNLAIKTGRKLTWDPQKETFVDDKEANALLSKAYRSPWKLS
ncbi:MAG: Gfo/Idh/MocA family oxidoreductase [Gemmataceae bacterium]|jgi:predicted dehydrogenase|nr:Gfo/Idh/MocA family oxidoreductase [Gemmataceae bacterium]